MSCGMCDVRGGLRGSVRYTCGEELCDECRRSIDEWFKAGKGEGE